MGENYVEDVKVDRYDLESNWEEQPSLYVEYSEMWAEAVKATEKAQERLKLLKDEMDEAFASLDNEIRTDWTPCFDKKPTEDAIKNWIKVQKKYLDIVKKMSDGRSDVIDAKEVENKLYGAKQGFEHRRAALEGLTKLMLGGYYAGKPSTQAEEEGKTAGSRGQAERINEKMRRRLKRKDQEE